MSLTGISPTSPIPEDLRELILGAGEGAGSLGDRPVILIGNKTAAGSETVDVLDATNPVADDADALARMGKRSELYWMYKNYVSVDPDAEIYPLAVTESGGTAAFVELTISGASDATTTHEISVHGEIDYLTVSSGDTQTVAATALKDKINSMANGSLQCIGVAAMDGAGPDYKVTVTASQKGPRHSSIIGATASLGLRIRPLTTGNAQTIVKNTGTYSAGTTEDDGANALVSASNFEAYYWALPWTATAAISATDNQIGEAVDTVKTQALPINGKEQICVCALIGTQAQATTVCTSAGANSVHLHAFHAENSDWTPAMLAAHYTAVKRSLEMAHPSAKMAGYTSTDNSIWKVPMPYAVADRATRTEVKADINNGASPLGTNPNGSTYVVRDITSKSQDASGNNDYKAREGHIYSAISFAWRLFKGRYYSQKQDFVDDNPAEGQMPAANTDTPDTVAAIMRDVIDDLTGSKPLGIYNGPILKPSKREWMKDHVVAAKIAAGISISAQLYAAEHNLRSETTIRGVDDAY